MTLSLTERSEVIRNYPLFSTLTSQELAELASLFTEQEIGPNTIIVNEGDPVDSIYLIARGAAEVSRKIASERSEVYNVATLMKGDAIGLSQKGFFSQTGLRSGTVISALPMILLVIKLDDFYRFLQNESRLSSELRETCENILFVNFIKQSHLFSYLTLEQIQQLIKVKQKLLVSAGEVVFKENDKANKCYFVLSGKIAITSESNLLAMLGPSSLFGEAAFVKGGKRNATATAETNSELFVLNSKQVKLIHSSLLQQKVDEDLISQLRPIPHPETSIIEEKTAENESRIFLYDPIKKAKLLLSENDAVIWNNLDGKTSLISILKNNSDRLSQLSIQDMYLRIVEMQKAGFLDLKKKTFFDVLMDKVNDAW